jgi:Ferritin-like domain
VSANRRQLLLAAAASFALARTATAAEPSDAALLGGLLDRERQLESAYATALAQGVIEPTLGERLLAHEREHVRALEQVLRGRRPAPVDQPPLPSGGRREFARAALGLEAAAVAAYVDALSALRNDRLLQPLGSIMACGAQHEVALRQVLGENLL